MAEFHHCRDQLSFTKEQHCGISFPYHWEIVKKQRHSSTKCRVFCADPVANWHKCVCDGHFTWHCVGVPDNRPDPYLDMGRSAGTFLTPDTDTVCSLIQPWWTVQYSVHCKRVIKVEMSQQDTVSGQQNYPWSETGHNKKPVGNG